MIADIQTFNCLGAPIEIQIRGRRNPKYKHTSDARICEDRTFEMYESKSDLLFDADFYRQNPEWFRDEHEAHEDLEGKCEWAFVIEQLVAEGTL